MNFRRKDYIFEPFKVTEVKCRSSELPRPRSGHRIACDDANIFCFGGYNPSLPLTNIRRDNPTWTPSQPVFKELWSFSIANRKWKQHNVIENMPEELASSAMCMSGRYLMIIGGTGVPFGLKCGNDLIVWRTCNEEATRFQILDVSGIKPPRQYGQAIMCQNGYLYSVGGTNGFSYDCDIYRLHLRTLVWETIYVGTGRDGEPIGRYRHEISLVGNKIYILGGGTGEWASVLMEIPVFDIETRTWSTRASKADNSGIEPKFPLGRKCHSAVQIDTPDGTQVFVAGGLDAQSVFKDIWRLNTSDLQWTLMQKTILPDPLFFHSSSVTSYGCMYVFGGIQPNANNEPCRNNKLYKVWLCIPKLSEICWEALLHFYPNMDQLDSKSLLTIGVPAHLVQRLSKIV